MSVSTYLFQEVIISYFLRCNNTYISSLFLVNQLVPFGINLVSTSEQGKIYITAKRPFA